jgi:hypothetical protein
MAEKKITEPSAGSWSVGIHSDNTDLVIRRGDGEIIANLSVDSCSVKGMSRREQRANANIMAASKDLLELLSEMFSDIENGRVDENFFNLRSEFRKITNRIYRGPKPLKTK